MIFGHEKLILIERWLLGDHKKEALLEAAASHTPLPVLFLITKTTGGGNKSTMPCNSRQIDMVTRVLLQKKTSTEIVTNTFFGKTHNL